MELFTPIFACGNIFTPFESTVISSVFVAWLVSLVLSFVNPCLIFFLGIGTRSKFTHLVVWALYVGMGLTVCGSGLVGGLHSQLWLQLWLILVFAVPILAASHFVTLLLVKRRVRLKKQTTISGRRITPSENDAIEESGPACVRCGKRTPEGSKVCPLCGWTQPV